MSKNQPKTQALNAKKVILKANVLTTGDPLDQSKSDATSNTPKLNKKNVTTNDSQMINHPGTLGSNNLFKKTALSPGMKLEFQVADNNASRPRSQTQTKQAPKQLSDYILNAYGNIGSLSQDATRLIRITRGRSILTSTRASTIQRQATEAVQGEGAGTAFDVAYKNFADKLKKQEKTADPTGSETKLGDGQSSGKKKKTGKTEKIETTNIIPQQLQSRKRAGSLNVHNIIEALREEEASFSQTAHISPSAQTENPPPSSPQQVGNLPQATSTQTNPPLFEGPLSDSDILKWLDHRAEINFAARITQRSINSLPIIKLNAAFKPDQPYAVGDVIFPGAMPLRQELDAFYDIDEMRQRFPGVQYDTRISALDEGRIKKLVTQQGRDLRKKAAKALPLMESNYKLLRANYNHLRNDSTTMETVFAPRGVNLEESLVPSEKINLLRHFVLSVTGSCTAEERLARRVTLANDQGWRKLNKDKYEAREWEEIEALLDVVKSFDRLHGMEDVQARMFPQRKRKQPLIVDRGRNPSSNLPKLNISGGAEQTSAPSETGKLVAPHVDANGRLHRSMENRKKAQGQSSQPSPSYLPPISSIISPQQVEEQNHLLKLVNDYGLEAQCQSYGDKFGKLRKFFINQNTVDGMPIPQTTARIKKWLPEQTRAEVNTMISQKQFTGPEVEKFRADVYASLAKKLNNPPVSVQKPNPYGKMLPQDQMINLLRSMREQLLSGAGEGSQQKPAYTYLEKPYKSWYKFPLIGVTVDKAVHYGINNAWSISEGIEKIYRQDAQRTTRELDFTQSHNPTEQAEVAYLQSIRDDVTTLSYLTEHKDGLIDGRLEKSQKLKEAEESLMKSMNPNKGFKVKVKKVGTTMVKLLGEAVAENVAEEAISDDGTLKIPQFFG